MSTVQPEPRIVVVERKGNGLGITGFVVGLVGALAGLIPLLFWIAFPLGILGMTFGTIGWRRAVREPERGAKGLSIAGMILGAIAFALAIIGVVIIDNALS
jgi:hypothetical protein